MTRWHSPKRRPRQVARRVRPQLEVLEGRTLPSTVTNLDDAGPGSLRQAILDTPAGGTVDFAPGLSGTIPLTRGELLLNKDLTIAGPGADVLTVSGNHIGRVFEISATFTVDISGLTVADGIAGFTGGAGILNAGTLTVTDSSLSRNTGAYDGGAIFDSGTGSTTIIDSVLSGNSASFGGGIASDLGPLIIRSSIISGNQVSGSGGGIYDGGPLVMSSSRVSDNTSVYGGGIYFAAAASNRARIVDSTLSGNSASRDGDGILAAMNTGGMDLVSSTLSGNSAGRGGGLILTRGTVSISSSTIAGNAAATEGGAIGNIADAGFPTTLTVANSTISGNSAESGGGIFTAMASSVSLPTDTLCAANTASAGSDLAGPVTSQGHNLIGDGTGGSGYDPTDLVGTPSSPTDPKLGPLMDNGGPTPTMALLPGSPAIAAGDPTNAPDTDQRGPGYARTVGGTIDIGAFEVQTTQVFPVTTTANAGAGSLRQAILDANAHPGYDVLTFDLPGGGVPTIAPTSPLPALTVPVFVNGTSQPGFAGAPLIVLNGARAGARANGLTLAGGLSSVRGLIVNGFGGAGVALLGAGGDLLAGDYLGTDATGSTAVGNGTGVALGGGAGSCIGISQTTPASRDLISGNRGDGIGIYGGSGSRVEGNQIGTDGSGTLPLGNGFGIELFSGSVFTTVGGTAPGAGNLISGNRLDGVVIYSDDNLLEGNRIGTDASGTAPLGNGGNGIAIRAFEYGYTNTLGGSAVGAGNTIANNGQDGVLIDTGTGNAVQENAIFGNAGLGIELRNHGNLDQGAPGLVSAQSGGSSTTVVGTLTSAPSTAFTLEFFVNPVCDPSGFGQGETFLGAAEVATDATGQAPFTATLQVAAGAGQFVTATATDPFGNTSVFSNCVQVERGASRALADRGPSDPSLSGMPVLAPATLPDFAPAPSLPVALSLLAPDSWGTAAVAGFAPPAASLGKGTDVAPEAGPQTVETASVDLGSVDDFATLVLRLPGGR
jgi:hypothetical protein